MIHQYLYAICNEAGALAPVHPGIDDATPVCVTHQDLAAWVTPIGSSLLTPNPESLWRHEAVIEALMASRTVLPVRFGTVLADEDATRAMLAQHHDHFCRDLERVRGRLELAVHVLWDPEANGDDCPPARGDASGASSGRAYLLARLQSVHWEQELKRQAEALALELHAPLAALADDHVRRVLITTRQLLSAAYLVQRDRLNLFREQVGTLIAAYPQFQFLLTGPWPAYSFVTLGPTSTQTAGEQS
jgi:hypothetical protein